jgi:hypothetical protein
LWLCGGRRFNLALFRLWCRPFGNLGLALRHRLGAWCPATVADDIQDKYEHKKGQEAD